MLQVLGMESQGITTMLSSLTRGMVTQSGKILPCLRCTKLHEYQTIRDFGKGAKPPHGYERIKVHLVFDVKYEGCHRSHLVS